MALPNLGRLSVCATGAPGDGDGGDAAQREALGNPDIIANILANLQINSNQGVQEIEKLACEAANRWCNLNSLNKAACAPDMYWQALTANVFPNGRSKPNADWTHRNWFFELCRRYRQYRKILSALNREDESMDWVKRRMEKANETYAAAMQDIADEELERMAPYDQRWSAYFRDQPPKPTSPWLHGPKPPQHQAYDDWWAKKMRNHEYPPYHPKHPNFSVPRDPYKPDGDKYTPAWDYANGLLREEEARIERLVAQRKSKIRHDLNREQRLQERMQASANYTVRLLRWAKNQMSNNQHKDEYPRPKPQYVHYPHSRYIKPNETHISDDSDDEGNPPPPELPHGTNPFDDDDDDDEDSSSE